MHSSDELWAKSFIYIFIFFLILGFISGYYDYRSILFYSLIMSLALGILFPVWWLAIIVSVKFLRAIFTMIDDYLENL